MTAAVTDDTRPCPHCDGDPDCERCGGEGVIHSTPAELDDDVEALVHLGGGAPSIAERLGVTQHRVRQAMRRRGLLLGRPGRRAPEGRGARTAVVAIKVSPEELEELERAAGDQATGAWVREIALRTARGE